MIQSYKGIDLFKLFFALCVIEIHWTYVFNVHLSLGIQWLWSLAVPYFFVASGFLMARSRNAEYTSSDFFIKRAVNILRLFIVWILIYFPLDLYRFHQINDYSIERFWKWLEHIVLFGEGCWSWPMWYLYALFVSLILMALATKIKHGFQWFFVLLCGLNILNHCELIGSDLINKLSSRALWGGVIIAGWMLPTFKIKYNLWLAISLLLLSFVFYKYGLPLNRLIGGIGALYLSLTMTNNKIPIKSTSNIRAASMWIYYIHMYFVFIISYIISRKFASYADDVTFNITLNIFAILFIAAIGFGLVYLSNTKYFQFLKRLIK